jgi:hypothetical protein
VLGVPSRYIGEESGKKYVKLLTSQTGEQTYVLTEVETGIKGKDMTEIIKGLNAGQKIIPYY